MITIALGVLLGYILICIVSSFPKAVLVTLLTLACSAGALAALVIICSLLHT